MLPTRLGAVLLRFRGVPCAAYEAKWQAMRLSQLPLSCVKRILPTLDAECAGPTAHARAFWKQALPFRQARAAPVAPKHPERRQANGYSWIDDYAWFDDMPASFMRHLKDEQRYYDAYMARLRKLQAQLHRELEAILSSYEVNLKHANYAHIIVMLTAFSVPVHSCGGTPFFKYGDTE